MSENKLPEMVYSDLGGGLLKTIGDSLNAAMYLKFGNNIEKAADYKALHELRRKVILEKAEESIKKVPLDALRSPDMQTLRLAAADADFCLESESLSEMFSNLLVSCFDARKQVHPAFSTILKSLSPLDIQNFALLDAENLPVVKISAHYITGEAFTFVYDVFIENQMEQDIKAQAASLDNLKRLHLVKTDYSHSPPLKQHEHFNLNAIGNELTKGDTDRPKILNYSMLGGILSPTAFGISFFKACTQTAHG